MRARIIAPIGSVQGGQTKNVLAKVAECGIPLESEQTGFAAQSRAERSGPPTRRTRFLYISHTAGPGGAELALLRLVRHLNRDAFDPVVLFFAERNVAERLRAEGVAVHCLPLCKTVRNCSRTELGWRLIKGWRDILVTARHVWRVAEFVRHHRIDIVHTHSLKAAIIGGFATGLARKLLVWHVHNRIAADYLPATVVRNFKFLARRLPDFLITNSVSTLVTFLPTPPVNCGVVFPGVDRQASDVQTAPTHPIVGLAGKLSPTKGVDVFLRAAALVTKRYPRVRFRIIGSALFNDLPYEGELRRLQASLDLDGVLEFVGFTPDVPQEIGKLTMLVHASTTPEPFGQVVVEGMACEKPVIATNAGGVREIVVNSKTGWLVPPGDATAMAERNCWILDHPEEASKMGQAGRDRVRTYFGIERTARDTEAIYQYVLQPQAQRLSTQFATALHSFVAAHELLL